jgi:hypothetical protein
MSYIIDTPDDCAAQIIHLRADGISTVIRYLTANTNSFKLVSPLEARQLLAAGIRLGLVYEMGGGAPGQAPLTSAYGERDAVFSAAYAPKVGATPGSCIYFAADNDFSQSQIDADVLPYFEAVAKAMQGSGFNVGVYGSGLVCGHAVSEGYAKNAWLSGSMGWTNSRAYLSSKPKELVLVQQRMDTKIANLDADTDQALGDFGDFLPFASSLVS